MNLPRYPSVHTRSIILQMDYRHVVMLIGFTGIVRCTYETLKHIAPEHVDTVEFRRKHAMHMGGHALPDRV